MRGRAGSVAEISVFSTRISVVSGLEILPYEHFIPVTGKESNTMHFRDRTDITEFSLLFSLMMKLGIVSFDS